MRWSDAHHMRETRLIFARARIDNRDALIASLGLTRTATTEDILLALYAREAEKSADRLIGDFAFAIWDAERGQVYAARDVMGCQPVYFSSNPRGIFIAEQLEPLHDCEDVSDEVDEAFIVASLGRAFAHYERTCFAEIRKIPPGHTLIADSDGASLAPYWSPQQVEPRRRSDPKACFAEFRGLLRQAIADRLPEEGRVGVHVSGGLDCSAVAILTAELLAERGQPPPIAYTWYPEPHAGLGEVEKEEYERVNAVCARMGVAPVYTRQTASTVRGVLDRDNRVRPICNGSYNERQVLEQAAEAGVKVILSGFGGDETASFDGRGYLEELASSGRWRQLAEFARANGHNPVSFIAGRYADHLAQRFASDKRLQRLQEDRLNPDVSALNAYSRLLMPRWLQRITTDRSDDARTDPDMRSYLREEMARQIDPLPPVPFVRTPNTAVARCNLLRWAPLITRIESWSADAEPYGVRHAYPFFDRKIVEFALALPAEAFRDPNWKRLFFRKAMDPILPKEVCWREVKDDPARVDPLLSAMKEAFVPIGQRYADRTRLPDRARFVDIERLVEDLEEDALSKRSRMGKLVTTVEFLGTGEPRDAAD